MPNEYVPIVKLHQQFSYGRMGNLDTGRPTLGKSCPVAVYRLMMYTMMDAMHTRLGAKRTRTAFFDAGRLGGYEFAMHTLLLEQPFAAFTAQLAETYAQMGIATLAAVSCDETAGTVCFTLRQSASGSEGCPDAPALVQFDAGMLCGIMKAFWGRDCAVAACAQNAEGALQISLAAAGSEETA